MVEEYNSNNLKNRFTFKVTLNRIIFIECLLAVGTLVSPCMIDDIAVSGAHNGMGYLLIRVVLHPACHMPAYRTLNPGLIKRDINVHSVLSAGDGEILDVLSFQIKEL